jgi:hypothetical protein
MHTVLQWNNLNERDHLGDLDVDGQMILKWILEKYSVSGLN